MSAKIVSKLEKYAADIKTALGGTFSWDGVVSHVPNSTPKVSDDVFYFNFTITTTSDAQAGIEKKYLGFLNALLDPEDIKFTTSAPGDGGVSTYQLTYDAAKNDFSLRSEHDGALPYA